MLNNNHQHQEGVLFRYVTVYLGVLLLGTDSRCERCGSHLLQVHLIWALFVPEDPAGSPQRNHNNINIPVGAELDK